jgi:hypothetical protein|tara:strand:- start:146 stop:352 length:207 start_codon:yes stop_codon:yes gene_type:complete
MSLRDTIWIVGIILALGVTWGMTSQRISAMETDVDRLEEALILFTKMESRIAVIETEVKNINKKLDRL